MPRQMSRSNLRRALQRLERDTKHLRFRAACSVKIKGRDQERLDCLVESILFAITTIDIPEVP